MLRLSATLVWCERVFTPRYLVNNLRNKEQLLGFELGAPPHVQIQRLFLCSSIVHELWPPQLLTFAKKAYRLSEHHSPSPTRPDCRQFFSSFYFSPLFFLPFPPFFSRFFLFFPIFFGPFFPPFFGEGRFFFGPLSGSGRVGGKRGAN